MGAILQIIESQSTAAGGIGLSLSGLVDYLRSVGDETVIVSRGEELERNIGTARALHIHGWNYPLAREAARRARRIGLPYVLSPLGQWAPRPRRRLSIGRRLAKALSEKVLIRGARVVTAINEVEERVLRDARVHRNIQVLPYGWTFSRDAPRAEVLPPKRLLMLGPIEPALGCATLLKAFAELGSDADGWSVTLAGSDVGGWRAMLEAAVHRKGGEGRIEFADPRSTDEQMELLRHSSILAAPSLQISSAVSIMQAAEAGVVAVVAPPTAPPGLNSGLTSCGPSRAELREALRGLMRLSDAGRRELAESTKEKARALYDWSVLGPRYAELYRKISRVSDQARD